MAPPWRAVDPRRALPFAWEAFEPRLRPVDAGGPCLDARFDDAKLGFGTPLAGLRKLGVGPLRLGLAWARDLVAIGTSGFRCSVPAYGSLQTTIA